MANNKEHRVNRNIRSNQVYLINEEGENKGLVSFSFAIKLAEDASLDLVEMSLKDNLPLCKILDYGKFKYEQSKKQKPQHKIPFKELKLTPRIDKHDLNIKINQVKKWLEQGFKVSVAVQFKGRENTHKELGYEIIKQFVFNEFNVQGPKSEGNSIMVILTNK